MEGRTRDRFSRALIIDGIRTEKELCAAIEKITDILVHSEDGAIRELATLYKTGGTNLETVARVAELKISLRTIRKIKKEVLTVLKASTNKMVIASIELRGN